MIETLKRPIESDYTSYVAYTRALEQYCDSLEITNNLSNYTCVGYLTLAGIEDGKYLQSETNMLENTIAALQARLITCTHKKVPLLAYIGALNTPPAQPPQRTWVGLTDDDMPSKELDAFCRGARWADSKLKEKNT